MIKHFAIGTLSMGLALSGTMKAAPLTLSFSSVPGSTISFNGSSEFGFTTTGANSFTITNSTSVSQSSYGDLGTIAPSSSSTFKIGAVTTVGTTETASVTDTVSGSADTLTIADSKGDTLTGALNFDSITSTSNGAGGQVNYLLDVNLTNLVYTPGTGTNSDLQALAAAQSGIVTVTYAFAGGSMDLNALKSTATNDSYSGQIVATPEPLLSGLALLGVNGLLLALWRRRRASTL